MFGQNIRNLLLRHADTVIFDRQQNIGESAFFYSNEDIPSAFGLDAVKDCVLYQRLQCEAGDQARQQLFIHKLLLHSDCAAVTVFLDQKIILQQIQLIPQR
ncbi:hypothetical protein D3C73_1238210 [compost metagenome]